MSVAGVRLVRKPLDFNEASPVSFSPTQRRALVAALTPAARSEAARLEPSATASDVECKAAGMVAAAIERIAIHCASMPSYVDGVISHRRTKVETRRELDAVRTASADLAKLLTGLSDYTRVRLEYESYAYCGDGMDTRLQSPVVRHLYALQCFALRAAARPSLTGKSDRPNHDWALRPPAEILRRLGIELKVSGPFLAVAEVVRAYIPPVPGADGKSLPVGSARSLVMSFLRRQTASAAAEIEAQRGDDAPEAAKASDPPPPRGSGDALADMAAHLNGASVLAPRPKRPTARGKTRR